jgi:hypothetical protein
MNHRAKIVVARKNNAPHRILTGISQFPRSSRMGPSGGSSSGRPNSRPSLRPRMRNLHCRRRTRRWRTSSGRRPCSSRGTGAPGPAAERGRASRAARVHRPDCDSTGRWVATGCWESGRDVDDSRWRSSRHGGCRRCWLRGWEPAVLAAVERGGLKTSCSKSCRQRIVSSQFVRPSGSATWQGGELSAVGNSAAAGCLVFGMAEARDRRCTRVRRPSA